MSLIDELRGIEDFTPSHQPVINEVLEIVGKLIAYIEHGAALLEAAAQDTQARQAGEPANHVNELLSPSPPEALAASADQQAQIQALQQQVATLIARQQGTQVSVEPVEPTPDAPAVPPGPAPEAA
jgi:hypothetical protein